MTLTHHKLIPTLSVKTHTMRNHILSFRCAKCKSTLVSTDGDLQMVNPALFKDTINFALNRHIHESPACVWWRIEE